MQKWLGAGVLGCVWLVACGGKLIDGGPSGQAGAFSAGAPAVDAASAGAPAVDAPSAGAPAAGANTGGAGEVSGQGGTSGLAGAAASCPSNDFVYCTPSCRGGANYTEGTCVDGKRRCPAPLFDPNSCPAEACVLQAVDCCDHKFGARSRPECGADGLFGPCPVEFERNAKLCVADSAHTTDCGMLEGGSCTLEDALCETPPAHCHCGATDGGLVWSCAYDLL